MQYYVYQIVDPRTGAPFYIGKGTGRRAWKHLQGRSHNKALNERVAEIAAAGMEAQVDVVRRFKTDGEAIDFECILICATDGLVNVLAKGWKLTPAQEQMRASSKKEREFLRLGHMKIDWVKAVIAKYSRPDARRAWKQSQVNRLLDPDKTLDAVLNEMRELVTCWERSGVREFGHSDV